MEAAQQVKPHKRYVVWQRSRTGAHSGVVRYAVPVSKELTADLKVLAAQRQQTIEQYLGQVAETQVADYRLEKICNGE